MLRDRFLLHIGVGQRALQRVGLIDENGNFLDADQDSTLHDPQGVFRAQLRVLNSLSHWDTCSVNHFGRGLQMATNGVFTAASPRT